MGGECKTQSPSSSMVCTPDPTVNVAVLYCAYLLPLGVILLILPTRPYSGAANIDNRRPRTNRVLAVVAATGGLLPNS